MMETEKLMDENHNASCCTFVSSTNNSESSCSIKVKSELENTLDHPTTNNLMDEDDMISLIPHFDGLQLSSKGVPRLAGKLRSIIPQMQVVLLQAVKDEASQFLGVGTPVFARLDMDYLEIGRIADVIGPIFEPTYVIGIEKFDDFALGGSTFYFAEHPDTVYLDVSSDGSYTVIESKPSCTV